MCNDGNDNHWLKVTVNSAPCNRFGIGSKVRVTSGGIEQIREITAGKGAGAQEPPVAHFGLDAHDGPVEITVTTLCGDTLRRTLARPDKAMVISGG